MKKKNLRKLCSLFLSVLVMTFILIPTAQAKENIDKKPRFEDFISSIFIQDDYQSYFADSDTLNVDPNSSVTIGNKGNINLKKPTTHYVSKDELTPRIGKRIATRIIVNTSLDPKKEIKRSEQLRATTVVDSSFYTTFTDYLTTEGESKYVYPINLSNGQVLHAQLDLPNSSELDYDLYLFEVDGEGNMTLVDASEYPTYINGISGTLSEAVGIYNTNEADKTYAVFVQSYIGSSISQSFKLHIGINTNTDPYEADENVAKAINFTLNQSGSTAINVRSLNTMCDNDWFTFTVPSDPDYSRVAFTLDESSTVMRYKVEVYTNLSDGSMVKEIMTDNKVSLSPGRYYVRVASTDGNAITRTNYTLTVSPEYLADEIYITEFGGGGYATYYGTTLYRVNGSSTITVKGVAGVNGYVLPNATITVTVFNPNWDPTDLKYRTATVTTDGQGIFTATVNTSPSTASMSCLISGAISFMHYYDIGGVYAESGNAITDVVPIYIFAYSIYLG
ncbi:hypothetical protein [Mahella sp.]|uniref:hypothetical protein n=1 Tax=Mahella sp. TaxID=2798721 RepID=UPI0025BEC46C|nr:hypothetical protein [Mahella sp.]MBZ4666462.1 hypothetical protein [Mahella sp.]